MCKNETDPTTNIGNINVFGAVLFFFPSKNWIAPKLSGSCSERLFIFPRKNQIAPKLSCFCLECCLHCIIFVICFVYYQIFIQFSFYQIIHLTLSILLFSMITNQFTIFCNLYYNHKYKRQQRTTRIR